MPRQIELPPISFASRGFVLLDGTVMGWSLLDGDHREFHRVHGTTDNAFLTRWRQWRERGAIDIEERSHPDCKQWEAVILAWIEDHADEIVRMPRA